MLKIIARLEHRIGDNVYQFLCNQDAPTTEIKDVLCQFMKYVVCIEDAAAQKAKEEASEPPLQVSDELHNES